MNVSCNSSVSGNVHVDVLFQYAMIIVVLLLYIDKIKIKIINYSKYVNWTHSEHYVLS